MQYRFGRFRADRGAYRVWTDDSTVELTPKLLDLLFFFLDRPQTLVTKEELLDGVWPGANVTENALAQAISDLRDALGDEPASPTFIKTIARRGYRFVASVERTPDASIAPTVDRAAAPSIGAGSAASADATVAVAAGHVAPADRAPTGTTIGHATDPRRAIAVLDFTNLSGDPDVAWLGAGIAETVANDLAAFDALQVIDRWRVHDAARAVSTQPRDIAAALGAPLVVTGSYQRHGANLRITSRVVEATTQAVLADAKIDGALPDVFELQDRIAAALARDLGLEAASASHGSGRETANLDAYRAYVEGWLKIETLDADLTRAAMADFERAITLDPRYAMAFTGLATAELQMYEMTRTETHPQVRALASGVEHARHAVRLDERLAEAHATLSFLLVSAGEIAEARAAAQRAVALDPGNWRHHYRLGHALWGEARLREMDRALRLYPDFAWARFEMAMVHIARGRHAAAEAIVREGIAIQDRQARAADRFPAIGFHWLLGTLLAEADRHDEACIEFQRERAQASRGRLYGPEYAAASSVGLGLSHLARGRLDDALTALQEAQTQVPGLPRAALARSAVHSRAGRRTEADAAREQARRARAVVELHRPLEARLLDAADAALHGDANRAFDALAHVLNDQPPNFTGWAIGIDPLLEPLRTDARFGAVLARLAARAA